MANVPFSQHDSLTEVSQRQLSRLNSLALPFALGRKVKIHSSDDGAVWYPMWNIGAAYSLACDPVEDTPLLLDRGRMSQMLSDIRSHQNQ